MKKLLEVTALGVLVALVSPVSLLAATVTVVMSGLDNPRGLALHAQGALFVAEAGRGGEGPCIIAGGALFCYGPSGAVSVLFNGDQERVISGLPSIARVDGTLAVGPQDIAPLGIGFAYVTIGLQLNPARRDEFGEVGANLGTLVKIAAGGTWHVVADIAAHEQQFNPAGGTIDSNPYGLLADGHGGRVLTDAGGNSLLHVSPEGRITTLAVFPSRPVRNTDSVPTCVVVGPDQAFYVGELSGAPFRDGAANIYRVVPGEQPTVFLSGFKTVIDIAYDAQGNLWVLQHSTGATGLAGPGLLIRVSPDGTRTTVLGSPGEPNPLAQPTSLAIGFDGEIYISNRGSSPTFGEVLRVDP